MPAARCRAGEAGPLLLSSCLQPSSGMEAGKQEQGGEGDGARRDGAAEEE